MQTLDVWLNGAVAGRLERVAGGQLRFTYSERWLRGGGTSLSHSLPVRAAWFQGPAAQGFFANLLPEGDARTQLARRHGVGAENEFGLLAAVGGDCAGAVSLAEPGAPAPDAVSGEIQWLDTDELAAAIETLPRSPLLADPARGIRLSLPGQRDKLPVVVRGKRIGVPLDGTPSTHILKAPSAGMEDSVANEAYCLALAAELGLPTVTARPGRAGAHDYLLIERYDRVTRDRVVRRLHQEDFCQALGVPPELKYEADGGPTAADCFALVRSVVRAPARDILTLVDAFAFNLLIGNHDVHAKSFSLLHTPAGTRLAPLSDLISTSVYPEGRRKLALRIGGRRRPRKLQRRHIERFAEDAGLGPAAVCRRLAQLARQVPGAAARVADEFAKRGEPPPVLERIEALVEERSEQLRQELAA